MQTSIAQAPFFALRDGQAELIQYQPGWIYYRLLELRPPLEIWQAYAALRGYKLGWAWIRHSEQQAQQQGGVA